MKNILKALCAISIICVVGLFGACKNSRSDTPINNAPGSQASTQAGNISLEKAIEAAVAHAGVSRSDARFTQTKLDSNDEIPNYEIEFIAGAKEYEYKISVADGSVIEYKEEAYGNNSSNASQAVEPATQQQNGGATAVPTRANQAQSAGYISVDDAKALALKDAGITSSDVVFEKASFDGDDLVAHYDIEFYFNGYEYDYEINAKTGAVIEMDRDIKTNSKTVNSIDTSDFITAEQAKAKAFAHAGVNAADAKRIKVELDADDIVPKYDIEFSAGQIEYEYEINAKTGAVIEFDKDRID